MWYNIKSSQGSNNALRGDTEVLRALGLAPRHCATCDSQRIVSKKSDKDLKPK